MNKPEIHPAADLFPLMSDQELEGLTQDIRENGQREPVTFWNGKLVDGRNRVNACKAIGIEADACELDPDTDPVKWVVSHNLHRRHLNASQKSQVALKLKKLLEPEAKERQKSGLKKGKANPVPAKLPERSGGDSRDRAASMLGISGKLVDAAEKVEKKGVPELAAAVTAGKVSVTRAAKIADEPQERQVALIAEPRKKPEERSVFTDLRRVFDSMTDFERTQSLGMWEMWIGDEQIKAAK